MKRFFIKKNRNYFFAIISAAATILLFFTTYVIFTPSVPSAVTIKKGMSLRDTSVLLKERGVIHSALAFRFAVELYGGSTRVVSGQYSFSHFSTLFKVASRVIKGEYGIPAVSVFFPEGSTVSEMAEILSSKIPDFDKNEFVAIGSLEEGYLFPDTYLFLSTITPKEAVEEMKRSFNSKIAGLEKQIKSSGKPLKDIIIMASIIEEETNTPKSRRIVSGILWKRLKIDMLLQVDAPLRYERGKNTFELTYKDLALASPYNTYQFKGLPQGPITNPGLDSIIAAIEPENTSYLFYISDRSGNMHYASNLSGHNSNIKKYLR